ncbi:Cytosine-specific methyltransferase [Rhynchospora pubera]|uniref:DNA (cytosine-5)-methyltransferase n=1 Tax=Rhynchospora pubera TaxID=906938 RepID=A0AAV8BN31_9POAL|nr:Cytosine-specific methyltransferase [Rhynchospora pubera]
MARNSGSSVSTITQRSRGKASKNEEITENGKIKPPETEEHTMSKTGSKRGRGKTSNAAEKAIANGDEAINVPSENGEALNISKRPRRAAACASFKEKSLKLSEKDCLLISKEKNQVVDDEVVAVELTKLGPEDSRPFRKIVDFILHDSEGNPQPFEMSEIGELFITALVMPMDDKLMKEKERGVRCEGFGRIESWAIAGYDEGFPIIWVSTEIAEYECLKPAGSYKKHYEIFYGKARICIEVYRKLAKGAGGNPDLGLEELLAGVVRSIGSTSKDFIISLGEFVYNQLNGLEDVMYVEIPALVSLRDECKSRNGVSRCPQTVSNGSIKIKEVEKNEINDEDEDEDEDEKLARLLQEEEEWKLMKQQKKRCKTSSHKNVYIKISEEEIANDYPLPAFYKPVTDEMDEYIFDCDDILYTHDLPRRVLNNWALYNSDSRLISLELVPMTPGTENDVMVFGSGFMKEDDGSGFCLEAEVGQASGSGSGGSESDGVAIYLSAIKEWMIEFGSSMVFISVRTDVAWYRLGKPTKQYASWYEPVLKTARLAIAIITLLKEQSRASKLSFSDVIKKVSEFNKENASYISTNQALVERYIVVHGQIILQQFAEYPDDTIRKCAFVTGLTERMEQRRHIKLQMKKKVASVQKGENLNPSASMGHDIASRRKVMRATTTQLINRIWSDYYSNDFPEDKKEPKEVVEEENENENEEDNEEENEDENENENINIIPADEESGTKLVQSPQSVKSTHPRKSKSGPCEDVEWVSQKLNKTESGETMYRKAVVKGMEVTVGGVVVVEDGPICYIEYMYEKESGIKMAHGRVMQKGIDTVLGNAANEREVFLTNECLDFELEEVKEIEVVSIRSLPWGHVHRKDNIKYDKLDRAKAEERKKKGLPTEYYCKSLYCPVKGGFFSLPLNKLGLGNGVCNSCEERTEFENSEFKVLSKNEFCFDKVEYKVHDFVYVLPQFFGEDEGDRNGTYKGGRNVGLRPYVVCHLLEILVPSGNKATPVSTKVKARRFYRPDDISSEKAYYSDVREVYYSEEIVTVSVDMIEGKCEVIKKNDLPSSDLPVITDHIFFCEHLYDPTNGSLKQLPPSVRLVSLTQKAGKTISRKNKGKAICNGDDNNSYVQREEPQEDRLATLDIFAGCGGLSEGLQRSGVSLTKWAIEYEQPAGEAFSENHPEGHMFIDNCNVILRAIMEKCGDVDDCISTTEADELAAKFDEEKIKNLPIPGEVEFINGGPPCQGFSGMNRFNKSTWSKVQCEMILAFLSFADYFRPKYFLLENVRNFVSFNKGQTFRLAIASLIEMGYQVRFGILEAGAFGVAQSRKRAFIWAAAPNETLPDWPQPMHVFASPQLRISLSDGQSYAAVCSTANGAPFRSITVRDTIGDLPEVENGANKVTMDYKSDPVSWFQKKIRGNMIALNDHISKEMNELNLIRCKHIPKRPGADWRDLPDEKIKLSTGQTADLIPWCLPNTAKRHNQWKGLFGRLDWEGNFPTSITDPQPMGKVGMCFHPEQDRILTVRECARSQGFPDSYKFSGNIINKHRQIGNAVPPPLAYALGRKLKEAVNQSKIKNIAERNGGI